VWVHNGCGPNNWNDTDTLADHFARHGQDFGATDEDEYSQMANDFWNSSSDSGASVKYDPLTGTSRVYDPATNSFGSYSSNGNTLTYFKPPSPNYFLNQPGYIVK